MVQWLPSVFAVVFFKWAARFSAVGCIISYFVVTIRLKIFLNLNIFVKYRNISF